jgi:hypothetical protein
MLLARDGMSDIPIHYIDPVAVHAPITNPRARLYMDMLTSADRAFSALERAWLFGLIDTRARRTHGLAECCFVRAVSGTIRGEYTSMARRLRGEAPAGIEIDDGCGNGPGFDGGRALRIAASPSPHDLHVRAVP